MALLWADGFDHYGEGETGRTNMLLGVYAEVTGGSHIPNATNPRNGLYSIGGSPGFSSRLRRTFGSTLTTVGVGGAFWVSNLPVVSGRFAFIVLADATNTEQISISLSTTGELELRRGGINGTIIATSAQVITAGVWHHVEVKFIASSTIAATDGTVIVRVNDVAVITQSANIDNIATANLEVSQVWFMRPGSTTYGITTAYVDDIFAWDSTGSNNNDFIGDKDVLTYYPDSDGATTDWVRNTGSTDYSAVDYASTEPDGDTTYLQAASAADVEDLGIETVPSTVTNIVAVVGVNVLKKTEATAATVTPAIVGGSGAVDSGSTHTMTESYAYYHDVYELDPDTSAAWTASTISASSLRLTRAS